MTNEFREIVRSLKKLQQSLRHQLKGLRIDCTSKISVTGSEALENSGLYLLAARSLRNPQFESMANDVRVAELLQQIVEIQSSSRGKAATVFYALRECFLKMSGLDISAVLQEAVPDPPRDFAFIMMQFLEWCVPLHTNPISSTVRKLMEMSMGIFNQKEDSLYKGQTSFAFPWQDRGEYNPGHAHGLYIEKCYGCKPVAIKPEPALAKDLEVFIVKGKTRPEKLACWAWMVCNEKRQKLAGGYCGDDATALDRTMQAFFEIVTAYKFLEANTPRPGYPIVLYGNFMDEPEFLAAKKSLRDRCTVFSYDDRTRQIFVVGWPSLRKEKHHTSIHKVLAQPSARHVRCPSNFDYTLETLEGKRIEQSLDWYLYKPEERVEGVVICNCCKQLFGVISQDCRWTQTLGVLCGVCRDELYANDKLTDDAFD